MLHSSWLRSLAELFNLKRHLAHGTAVGIADAALALHFLYLWGRPRTTALLRGLYAYTLLMQRVFSREESLEDCANLLKFGLWLESDEPLAAIQPLIEHITKLDRKAHRAGAATMRLLFTARYDEAREASRLWCAITEEWSHQGWQPNHRAAIRINPIGYGVANLYTRIFFRRSVESHSNRYVGALHADLAGVTQLEKNRIRRKEGKLRPGLTASESNEIPRLSGSLAQEYQEAHLARALLEWSKEQADAPATRLLARGRPRRNGFSAYLTHFDVALASALGMGKHHYLRILKEIATAARNDPLVPTSADKQHNAF